VLEDDELHHGSEADMGATLDHVALTLAAERNRELGEGVVQSSVLKRSSHMGNSLNS
jgi:hypothetical protein